MFLISFCLFVCFLSSPHALSRKEQKRIKFLGRAAVYLAVGLDLGFWFWCCSLDQNTKKLVMWGKRSQKQLKRLQRLCHSVNWNIFWAALFVSRERESGFWLDRRVQRTYRRASCFASEKTPQEGSLYPEQSSVLVPSRRGKLITYDPRTFNLRPTSKFRKLILSRFFPCRRIILNTWKIHMAQQWLLNLGLKLKNHVAHTWNTARVACQQDDMNQSVCLKC